MERHRYIETAHTEHLRNKNTYRQLTEEIALGRVEAIKRIIRAFVKKHLMELDNRDQQVLSSDGKFVLRCIQQLWTHSPIFICSLKYTRLQYVLARLFRVRVVSYMELVVGLTVNYKYYADTYHIVSRAQLILSNS